MPLQQATLAQLHFTELDKIFIDEHIQNPSVREINQGGQERGAGHWLLIARRQHSQCIAQNGAAHTEAQCIDLLSACDILDLRDGLDGCVLDVIVPRFLGHRLIGVAPANHKRTVPLADCVANEGIVGL